MYFFGRASAEIGFLIAYLVGLKSVRLAVAKKTLGASCRSRRVCSLFVSFTLRRAICRRTITVASWGGESTLGEGQGSQDTARRTRSGRPYDAPARLASVPHSCVREPIGVRVTRSPPHRSAYVTMASVQQYLSVLAGAQSGANAEAQRAAAQMQIEVRATRRPRPETTRRCPTFLFNPAAAGLRARSPLTTARSPRRVSSSLTHARTSYRSIQQLKTGDPRNAINVCMQLIARGQPLEARHFGYGVLQHVVAKRWSQFTQPERQELAKLVYDKLSECGAVPADEPPEPFMIKSKVATLMAQVVRQEGVGMWSSIMPEMAAGACSESPVQAELSALVMRYVAEDVAVYNSDILGGRMKELLYGLTSTLPQALPAMYRLLEVSEDFFTFVFDFVFPVSPAPALRLGPGLDAADEQTQGSTNRTSSCGILITSI